MLQIEDKVRDRRQSQELATKVRTGDNVKDWGQSQGLGVTHGDWGLHKVMDKWTTGGTLS